MKATISNVCIRGCEPKSGRGGDYLLVRFEDETGKPAELVDKDMDRIQEPYGAVQNAAGGDCDNPSETDNG